ncbi:MAG: hypothetical protein MZV64_34380 [Ignavibacteriales bacterium]|nr:hypothetical protein [Ignavibacteriales bacterium]
MQKSIPAVFRSEGILSASDDAARESGLTGNNHTEHAVGFDDIDSLHIQFLKTDFPGFGCKAGQDRYRKNQRNGPGMDRRETAGLKSNRFIGSSSYSP